MKRRKTEPSTHTLYAMADTANAGETVRPKLLSWSQNVMFSYDVNEVYGDSKIAGTDIYQSVGFSAAHIMYIIRALLDKYDIDRGDFVYSARSTKTVSTETE